MVGEVICQRISSICARVVVQLVMFKILNFVALINVFDVCLCFDQNLPWKLR